jgi:hypothetical protein
MIDRKDIIRMAKEARMPYFYGTWEIVNVDGLERFAALVAAHEREECAKVCESYQDAVDRHKWPNGYECATAIRARREQ